MEYGVPREADFPYTITDPGPDNRHWDAPRIDFAEWYRIPPNDIETTKRVIQSFGAVDAAVLANSDFKDYSGGIFQNTDTSVKHIVPYNSSTNHLISLVGWEDDPGGGMGYWILRNSWSIAWGEAGYMRIRYTSARTSMEGSYILYKPWGGEDVHWDNAGEVRAAPWSAGGTTNAHAVDIWGGAKSSVTNTGILSATASGAADLKIDSYHSDSLLSLLGFHAARSFQLEKFVLISELRARWDHDYLADSESLGCRFIAAGPSVNISGRDTAEDSLLLGVSLNASLRKNIAGYLDYDYTLQDSDGYQSHLFNVGLKVLF